MHSFDLLMKPVDLILFSLASHGDDIMYMTSVGEWIGGDEAVDGHVREMALDGAVAPQHGLEAEPSVL